MYYLVSYDVKVKNNRNYLKAVVGDTKTGVLNSYTKCAFNKLSRGNDILGYVRKSRYIDEYIHSVDDEYLSLLKYVKSGAYKLALAGNLIAATYGGKINNFVDITDLREKFCLENNINRRKYIYYPQADACVYVDKNSIRYFDNDIIDGSIEIYSTEGMSKVLEDNRTYYNIDDGCLYMAFYMVRTGKLLFIRMVDFKYKFIEIE